MIQTLKGKARKIANTVAASILLFSQFAVAPAVGATQQYNTNDWQYWCSTGVKFDTGAVGTHSQNVTGGSASITIVDPDKTEVSNVTGTGVEITKVVVKGGNETYPGVINGSIAYTPPFTYNLKAPLNGAGQQSDISHVIVCYEDKTTVEVVKNLVPSSDEGKFELYVNNTKKADDVGDEGTTGKVVIGSSFDLTVKETAESGTALSDYNTSVVCKEGDEILPVKASDTSDGQARYLKIDEDDITRGDDIVCTFTNTRKTGDLTVTKHVINDNGGDKTYADFTFKVDGEEYNFEETVSPNGSKTVNLPTGTEYEVTEPQADEDGYKTTYSEGCKGTIVESQAQECVITNDDQPGTLIVKKVVKNDNGGTKEADDFSFSVNGAQAVNFEADGKNDFTVNAGTYNISETAASGYATTYDNCTDVVVPNGGSATCTITNDDEAALLTVVKKVTNDNGGTKVAPDFTMYVSGTSVSDDEFPGDEKGTTVSLYPGSYSVTENGLAGYTGTRSDDCTGSIALGEHKYCTITNDDDAPVLVLIKKVLNYNGGTASETDWLLSATGPTPISGWGGVISGSDFSAGSYSLSESDGPSGYTPSTWTCIGGSQEGSVINLGLGEVAACTIVNSDNPAKITVTKEVVNNNGGTAEADDFTLWVGNTKVVSGVAYEFAGNEDYTVSESDGPKGYEQTSLTCVDTTEEATVDNPFKAELGHNYECTIVNDDVAPTLKIKKWTIPFRSEEQFNFSSEELDAEFTLGSGDSKEFEDLQPGTYTVTEASTDGWFLKNIYCWGATDFSKNLETGTVTVTLELGDEATCKFLNAEFGSVNGFKFEDVNGDGHFDSENEPKLSGWTITLTKLCKEEQSEEVSLLSEDGYTCESFEDSTVTGEDGHYSFDGLKPGLYKVCEVLQDGWVQTAPGTEDGCRKVWVGFGSNKFVKFGNFELGKIKGVKFNDVNGNGKRDNTEPTLKGWTIKLTKECAVEEDAVARFLDQAPEEGCDPVELTTVTDANGAYSFTGLEAGDYTVCEVQQANWTQTFPADNNGCHKVTVAGETSGEVITADFGNKAKPQVLGESTQLVNTGASTTKGMLVGLSILGALGALHLMVRRKSYTN